MDLQERPPKWGPRRISQTFASLMPWWALPTAVASIVSAIVWMHYVGKAASATKHLLLVFLKASTVHKALSILHIVEGVAVGVAVGGAAVLLLLQLLRNHQKALEQGVYGTGPPGRRGRRAYLAASVVLGTLWWLAVLYIVLLLACCVAWLLASGAMEEAAKRAVRILRDQGVDQAAGMLDQAGGAVADLQTQYQRSVRQQLPADIRSALDGLFNTVASDVPRTEKGGAREGGCQPGCIDLGFLAGLLDVKDRCICYSQQLTDIQTYGHRSVQALIPGTIWMLVLYIAASLLMLSVPFEFGLAKASNPRFNQFARA